MKLSALMDLKDDLTAAKDGKYVQHKAKKVAVAKAIKKSNGITKKLLGMIG